MSLLFAALVTVPIGCHLIIEHPAVGWRGTIPRPLNQGTVLPLSGVERIDDFLCARWGCVPVSFLRLSPGCHEGQ